jgi:hypothetical protein
MTNLEFKGGSDVLQFFPGRISENNVMIQNIAQVPVKSVKTSHFNCEDITFLFII